MSSPDWHCPDADEHGFVAFEVLEERAAGSSREQFLEDFPVPGLLVIYRAQDSSGAEADAILDPTDRGVQLLTVAIKSSAILRYLGRVAFLAKRPGNPFAHLISVGRSANNDVTLAVDSVSKVHGYFVRDESGWSFIDHGSTNGSRIDDLELVSGERYPLADGNVLQLGLEALLEFLSPESLYRRALQKRR